MHAGKWEKKSLQGAELRGKTLGIVGLGRIGLEVARRAAGFGMDLIGYDPFVAPVIARENDVTLVPIDEIFTESDYLTLHVGLTPQTDGLINATSLAIMKKGVRIINCARGELIVERGARRCASSPATSPAPLSTSSTRSRSRTHPSSSSTTSSSRRTSPDRPTRRRRPSASSSPCRCATT